MGDEDREFSFCKRVFLTDTNAEGNVYFARYFDWQGMAREDFFRQAVPDHLMIMAAGVKLITMHAWVKYEQETRLFDEIEIRIRTVSLKKMSMELGFTYFNSRTKSVIAIGGQKLAFSKDGKLVPIPPSIRAGASTCLITPGSKAWHMMVINKIRSKEELLMEAPS